MAVYTVHEPPRRNDDVLAHTERFTFVRDGFSWPAFLFAPLWMLRYRLWLALIVYLLVVFALGAATRVLGDGDWPIAISLLVLLLVGFEASTLRRYGLARRGWTTVGVVVGDDLEAAERRFFDAWAAGGVPRPATPPSAGPAAPVPSGPIIGLFPEPRSSGVTVAIVDYGSGNLHSAAKAFERAARESGHEQPILVTSDPDAVRRADRVVLPGVGAFADCRRGLDAVSGMVEALEESVRRKGRPFLGICVGMQLMAERGREYVVTEGLGWIPGEVDRIEPKDHTLKVPHMGWNTLDAVRPHPLLDGIATGSQGLHAYFVHSYHLNAAARDCLVAQADYGGPVTAMVARDTYAGTQFHPEKSQRLGLALIANFLKWSP